MAGQAPRGQAAFQAPRSGTLPPVRVLLPDGEVGGGLVRRWQTGTGQWVYRVALRGWISRAASTGSDLTEELIEMDVPGDRVRPVPGVSYDVPTLRRQPRPTLDPAAAVKDAPAPTADGAAGWICEQVRLPAARGSGLGFLLHQPGCWAITGKLGGTLGTGRARSMVAGDPIAEACDVCDARKVLTDPTK